MKILSINNNYQPRFGVNLPKKEGPVLIEAALTHDKEAGIPKLFTMLELLDKMSGKKAELKTIHLTRNGLPLGYHQQNQNLYQLRIDDKLIEEDYSLFDMLYAATTSEKTEDGKKIPMLQAVFETMWHKNTDKTAQDIEQLLKD